MEDNRYVGAICAAPSILGHMGYLDEREITCYPGFESQMPKAYYTGEQVVVSDNIIMGKGPAPHRFCAEIGGSDGIVRPRQSAERVNAMLKKDIRVQKNELRDKMKRFRREMPPLVKQKKDMAIRRGVQSLKQYQACQTLLTFVSTDIEVDTRGLIGQALRDGKKGGGSLLRGWNTTDGFYYIQSMKDLAPPHFLVC